MGNQITYLEAAKLILEIKEKPLNAKEIVDEITKNHLREVSGKTPWFTINARISEDIQKKGEKSDFKRVGRGRYALRIHPDKEYSALPFTKKIPLSDKVLVFSTTLLDKIGRFHGISKDYEKYLPILTFDNSFEINRIDAEKTEDCKQIISYVIIKHGDSVLRYVRGKVTSVKNELENSYSIGFGGHVQNTDNDLFSKDMGYSNSVKRELKEEINISLKDDQILEFSGVLNDDSSSLGKRHFAFIHILEVADQNITKNERSVNELTFIKISELGKDFAKYEYWSKLCIQYFFGTEISLDCIIETKPSFSKLSDIVAIVGYIGSGKSEACTLLQNKFSFSVIRVSEVLANLVSLDSNKLTRTQLQEAGLNFVSQDGGQIKLAEAILNAMRQIHNNRIVIDGLRYPETLKALKSLVNKPINLIYINTTIDKLFSYYIDREQSSIPFIQYLKYINHPVEREIDSFMHLADIIVYNDGTLISYLEKMKEFFDSSI